MCKMFCFANKNFHVKMITVAISVRILILFLISVVIYKVISDWLKSLDKKVNLTSKSSYHSSTITVILFTSNDGIL